MNISKKISDRIEKRLTETKTPCKLYKTEAGADKAADKAAPIVANALGMDQDVHHLAVHVPSIDRWAISFDVTRAISMGGAGFIAMACELGHSCH